MDLGTRWRRLDAEHWVHVWGMVVTTVLWLWTMWCALVGLATGFLLVAVLPAAVAVLAGWLTSAWRRERAWAWWVWTVLTTIAFLSGLTGLGDPWPVTVPWLLVTGTLLALLAHPDSRARIGRPAAASQHPYAAAGAADTTGRHAPQWWSPHPGVHDDHHESGRAGGGR